VDDIREPPDPWDTGLHCEQSTDRALRYESYGTHSAKDGEDGGSHSSGWVRSAEYRDGIGH